MDIQKLDPHFRQTLRENFTEGQLTDFTNALTLELQGRIVATPDEELPSLKHQITFVGELRNIFAAIFQPKEK